jgi:formylglycine-generating enzyme required for sulfatase activity
MHRFFLLLFFGWITTASILGQNCCSPFINSGNSAFDKGDYESALRLFNRAKECPDKDKCSDIAVLISKTQKAIEAKKAKLIAAKSESSSKPKAPVRKTQDVAEPSSYVVNYGQEKPRVATNQTTIAAPVKEKEKEKPAACYLVARAEGMESYKAEDFKGAILVWQNSIKYCHDIPKTHDLDDWIKKAQDAIILATFEPEMVKVQGGSFQMGSNDGRSDEKPVHSVSVNGFYIGKYELTVGHYLQFCKETNGNWPDWLEAGNSQNVETGWNSFYKGKGYSRTGSENLPIVGISWNDAVAYCQWLSKKTNKKYRLPTEAEWEFAAKGGNQNKSFTYSGSNTAIDVAWYNSNSDNKFHPVGQRKANELGIYDMSGNVWEWCSDGYDENYYKISPAQNPIGSNSSSTKVLRGGSWNYNSNLCRPSTRNGANSPSFRGYYFGFRVARND